MRNGAEKVPTEAAPPWTSENTCVVAGGPAVLLGCMLLGSWGKMSSSDVDRVVSEAIDVGIAGFDTAAAYGAGQSEELLGIALRSRRNTLSISTKVLAPLRGDERRVGSVAACRTLIEQSLRRLRTDFIDRLYVHRVDDDTLLEPMLVAMASACAAGKVGQIGTSCMSPDLLVDACRLAEASKLTIGLEQCKYSLLDRTSEAGFHPVARRLGIKRVHYGVLEEGLLARQGDVAGSRPEHSLGLHPWPESARQSLGDRARVAAEFHRVAQAFGLSLLQLAVAFASEPDLSTGTYPDLVAGVSRSGQIQRVVAASQARLPVELLDAIDQIVAPGFAVGVPDRSRLRRSLFDRRNSRPEPLVVGHPVAG